MGIFRKTAKVVIDSNVDEHFVPSHGLALEDYAAEGDISGAHHLARYQWLIEALSGKERSVLDVGCGVGYGTYLIARRLPAARVVGVDYDAAALREAGQTYGSGNLSFISADAMRWDAPEMAGPFDAIVAFDSLEHIPHRELVLEHVVRHLEDDGTLYFSTPCAAPDNDLKPEWFHHRIEYGTASLYDLLSRYFRRVERSEEPGFPALDVFRRLRVMGIDYALKLNPVICRGPIKVENPYR